MTKCTRELCVHALLGVAKSYARFNLGNEYGRYVGRFFLEIVVAKAVLVVLLALLLALLS